MPNLPKSQTRSDGAPSATQIAGADAVHRVQSASSDCAHPAVSSLEKQGQERNHHRLPKLAHGVAARSATSRASDPAWHALCKSLPSCEGTRSAWPRREAISRPSKEVAPSEAPYGAIATPASAAASSAWPWPAHEVFPTPLPPEQPQPPPAASLAPP